MHVEAQNTPERVCYTLYKERAAIGRAVLCRGGRLTELWIEPAWRRRGYGSYLLKEVLHRAGGYDRQAESCFTAPLPAQDGAALFAGKFGFIEQGGRLCRRRVPEMTAVALVHRALRELLPGGGFYLDATCGNGHDTLFLAGLAGGGQVLGLDIQPAAVAATNALLAANGFAPAAARAVLADHRLLGRYVPPGGADCVLFNFGWLPGAAHEVHSAAESSLPALQAGLDALRPGGVLAAVLYSGRVIGRTERDAALAFFRALPLTRYTVLVCEFANWDETAPLPCLVVKKAVCPP